MVLHVSAASVLPSLLPAPQKTLGLHHSPEPRAYFLYSPHLVSEGQKRLAPSFSAMGYKAVSPPTITTLHSCAAFLECRDPPSSW